MKEVTYSFLLVIMSLLTSCTISNQLTRGQQYSKLYEERPVTLVVMPPINNSTNVEAKDLLYTSISYPLIEAGYYVISPHLAMEVLKSESAYDAELFIDRDMKIFKVFGADAVVFSVIDSWTKRGFGIDTDIRYIIKSVYTNEILFERSCKLYLDLSVQNSGGGLFGASTALLASVINTAVTDHIVAARRCNYYIFKDIPRGKYNPMYMQDQNIIAEPKDANVSVH